jgi:hypothetical protein
MLDADSTQMNNFYLTGKIITHILKFQIVLGGLTTVGAAPGVETTAAVVAAIVVVVI